MRAEEENVYQHPVTAVWVLFITCHLVSILPLDLATARRTSVVKRNVCLAVMSARCRLQDGQWISGDRAARSQVNRWAYFSSCGGSSGDFTGAGVGPSTRSTSASSTQADCMPSLGTSM